MRGVIGSRGGSPSGAGRCVSEWNVYAQHMATMILMCIDLVEYYSTSYHEFL